MTTSTTPRSDVEYLFDESHFERSVLPGAEIQQHTQTFAALRAHGAPCTQLLDFTKEELDADWQLALLHDTIAGSFSELIASEPLHRVKDAAIAWQVNLLHSDETSATIQTGCEWLQGVIDAVEQAETGAPTVWWPGKRSPMSDPRCKAGRWIKAKGCTGRTWHVRKASHLSTEVLDLKTGKTQVLPAFEARARFALVAYA
jgi:hypothetical protein